jgi:Winged helix DNA-binding domain
VQAQDFGAAKWALGLRTTSATDAEVEDAFNRGAILRTHVLRPTWHFVRPADIRWMLALTAPRVHAANASAYRTFGLDAAVFRRTNRALAKALAGRHLTRPELARILRREDIALGYVLMRAELDAVIVSGPLRGKQRTYALFDERVPPSPALARDEALAQLARRYFDSRAPATVKDFAWWSGLSMADAAAGAAMVDAESTRARHGTGLQLLPCFDECHVAYVGPRAAPLNVHTIVVDGTVVGTWRRTLSSRGVRVEVRLSRRLNKQERQALGREVERYGAFLGLPASFQL